MAVTKQKIVVVGAGGLGREIAAMLNSYFSNQYDLMGFVDDAKQAHDTVNGMYILGGVDWLLKQENLRVVIGIGNPQIKRKIVEQLALNCGLNYPNLIHPHARLHARSFIQIGKGNVITDGCILTTNISLGNFNLINLNTTIGHDAVIGNYCSIMPGVNISGGAHLKDRVYIGTGATLIKSTVLGINSLIGAGAVVHTDVPSESTFVGIPAKAI
jgi:sugar O-acyltransferase (sialic acid O-acetyltransferase NeuD family)